MRDAPLVKCDLGEFHRIWLVLSACFFVGCHGEAATICESPLVEDEVCIPSGTFLMGHERLPMVVKEGIAYNPAPWNTWAPEHAVSLSAFHIDAHEVTWGRYRKCVDAGICSLEGISSFPSTRAALRALAYQQRPAYNISYNQALTFCLWDGKRLPTEAEWERAARGTDGRDFPWGSQPPNPALLSALTTYSPTADENAAPDPVGSHAQDVSQEGVHDMFASVTEWVADWYHPDAYSLDAQRGAAENPQGPKEPVFLSRAHEYGWGNWVTAAGERVVRGARWSIAGGRAWNSEEKGAPIWFRGKLSPNSSGVGFRCARDDKPGAKKGFPVYRGLEWRLLGQKEGR